MKHHAKGPSAGSTMREASRLDRIFRGALATRASSLRADGRGAPSGALRAGNRSVGTSRRPQVILLAAVCAALFAMIPASAQAAFEYKTSFGSLGAPSGIAVDESTGNVFVTDTANGTVHIYGPEGGAPIGVANDELTGFNFLGESTGVGVDNSSSASAGALYVAEVVSPEVKKYAFNATSEEYEPAGLLSPAAGFTEPTGLTVDAHGNVYVSYYVGEAIIEFSPAGTEVRRFAPGAATGPLAVDPSGDLFALAYGGYSSGSSSLYKFEANSSGELPEGAVPVRVSLPRQATGLAANADGSALEVPSGDRIIEYDTVFGKNAANVDIPVVNAEFGSGTLNSTDGTAMNATTERLYVSEPASGSVFVFGPPPPAAPVAKTLPVGPVTETTAVIGGTVNPERADTTYFLEYSSDSGFSNASRVPAAEPADAGSGELSVAVSQLARGLSPDTTYFYRLIAVNSVGTTVGDSHTFHTLTVQGLDSCPNTALRLGPSAVLPDCRAYELVTPADTNAGRAHLIGMGAEVSPISSDGRSVIFNVIGSALPGTDAPSYPNDLYEAVRSGDGWQTALASPSYAESPQGSITELVSDEHEYWSFRSRGGGTLGQATYVEGPDKDPNLLAHGSSRDDPAPQPRWITPNGDHIIFTSQEQLTPDAAAAVGPGAPLVNVAGIYPNNPVDAVYDRTPAGVKAVSLLPGDQTPPPGSTTYYRGVSHDGSSVAFNVDGTMYLRHNGATLPVVTTPEPGETLFAGISEDGERIVFLINPSGVEAGELYFYDFGSSSPTRVTDVPDARVVNVSADGSHIYFESDQAIAGGGLDGSHNLYVYDGSRIQFIATLPNADRHLWAPGWIATVGFLQQTPGTGPIDEPSRSTPDGKVFLFESRAQLTSSETRNLTEIYRYTTESGDITCISCSPTGVAPTSRAMLAPNSREFTGAPIGESTRVDNVTPDGAAVVFTSFEQLVPGDDDGQRDVYEWKQGRISLISYPHSTEDEWIFGMTQDGHDVLFTSSEGLTPGKSQGATAIYDARVDGGFAGLGPESGPCANTDCQAAPLFQPPNRIGTSKFAGPGNRPPRRCRAKKEVRKRRCRRHHRHHRHHRRHVHRTRTQKPSGRTSR